MTNKNILCLNLKTAKAEASRAYYFFLLPAQYSLHINCGGVGDIKVDGILYDKDMPDSVGAASYSSNGSRWALSSTGNFLDNGKDQDSYTVTSTAPLSMTNTELYRTARISPLSLTYYGFCLQNGSYNLTLHFAEIIFTDDDTYSSLGRRIFDVFIQVYNCFLLSIFVHSS